MMGELYTSYLKAFKRGLPVTRAGDGTFYVPSYSNPKERHLVSYDGEGVPLCTCKGGGRCWHGAAVVAFCKPAQQREWDERRIYESNKRALLIRQGKVNPKRYPRIRREMEKITERHPVTISPALCTRCGLVLADDMCASCWGELAKVWPGDPKFARELEQQDADERMRLSLGMGE